MELTPTQYYNLIRNNDVDDFEVVQDTITSSDPEDGGADHDIIIKQISTGKFYANRYSEWDIDYNTSLDDNNNVIETDLNCKFKEAFPKQITITVYE
jgi:hypothetical protein